MKSTEVAPVNAVPEITTEVPGMPLNGRKLVIFGGIIKFDELELVPDGVVTLIGPVRALFGTVVEMSTSEFTVKLAETPLNFTDVAPVNPVPETSTGVPTIPDVGEKEFTSGSTVKLAELYVVPSGVVTPMVPVVAPLGTVVLIRISDITENVAGVPLKVTVVALVNVLPEIETGVPMTPLVGVKFVIFGRTVKLLPLVAVPEVVVTAIVPVEELPGTIALICEYESRMKVAAIPLNVTDVNPVNAEPNILIVSPTPPFTGVNPVMFG